MKIESSRQTFIEQTNGRTNGRTFAFTGLLTEPKNVYIYFRRLEKLLLCGATQPEDSVWVYDKFRNVSGICENAGLKQVVMNFGNFANFEKRSKTYFQATSPENRFTTKRFIFTHF